MFFRIGGPNVGKADVSLEVNSDNVILDDIWAWRADHGIAGTVGWDINTAKTGVVVNGDDVTATGFFVEHYQQHNVVWNGNGGEIVFFQNEMAYDPPSQAAWMQAPGVDGWSALKVDDKVKTFKAYALGSYSFFNQGVDIFAANAFEVPTTLAPGSLHNMLTIFLDPERGMGGISNVVNGIGGASTIDNPDIPVTVTDYPAVPDTTAPTVAITDNVTAATATGDVTFTFTFSEDVRTSFTADDIVVAGGTKGAFAHVDATHATLVVAPPADSTGTIDVSVAAGTFSDAAGNANTASAAAQQDYDTVAPPPSGSVITFDESTPPTLTGFGGAEDSTIVVDPTNAANKVAQIVKGAGAAGLGGHHGIDPGRLRGRTDRLQRHRHVTEGSGVVSGRRNSGPAEGRKRRQPRPVGRDRRHHHGGRRLGNPDLQLREPRTGNTGAEPRDHLQQGLDLLRLRHRWYREDLLPGRPGPGPDRRRNTAATTGSRIADHLR